MQSKLNIMTPAIKAALSQGLSPGLINENGQAGISVSGYDVAGRDYTNGSLSNIVTFAERGLVVSDPDFRP